MEALSSWMSISQKFEMDLYATYAQYVLEEMD